MVVKDKPSILKVKQIQSACPVVATRNTKAVSMQHVPSNICSCTPKKKHLLQSQNQNNEYILM